MPAFRRLYIDTTVLRSSNWPHVSPDLRFVLTLARNFKIKVLFPEPVELERFEQWRRVYLDAEGKLGAAEQKRATLLSAIGVDVVKHATSDLVALEASYLASATKAKLEWDIQTTRTTSKSVADLFPFALERQAPFQESGDKVTGFQDTVILLSVIEDALAAGESEIALLSADEVFSKSTRHSKSRGIAIQIFKGADDIWKALADEIRPALLEWLKDETDRIEAAVELAKPAIETFLLHSISEDQAGYGVQSIEGIHTHAVFRPNLPLPPFPTEPGPYSTVNGASFRVSIELGITMDVIARKLANGFLALALLAGSQPAAAASDEMTAPEQRIKRAKIESTATFENGAYRLSDFTVIEVK